MKMVAPKLPLSINGMSSGSPSSGRLSPAVRLSAFCCADAVVVPAIIIDAAATAQPRNIMVYVISFICNGGIPKQQKEGQPAIGSALSFKVPHQRNAMKLRMTGFERSPSFVIRLGVVDTSTLRKEGWGPPSDS